MNKHPLHCQCRGSGRIYEHVQDDTGIPCPTIWNAVAPLQPSNEKLYTAADLGTAVAAALEKAAKVIDNEITNRELIEEHLEPLDSLAEQIRSLITADHEAALAELVSKAEEVAWSDGYDAGIQSEAKRRDDQEGYAKEAAEVKQVLLDAFHKAVKR